MIEVTLGVFCLILLWPSLQLAHLSELRGERERLHQALSKLHSSVEPVLMDASLASARSDLSAAEANMAPLSAREMNPLSVAPHTAATKHRGDDNDDLTDLDDSSSQAPASATSGVRALKLPSPTEMGVAATPGSSMPLSARPHLLTVPGSTDGSSAANTPSEGPSPADNSAKQKKTATFTKTVFVINRAIDGKWASAGGVGDRKVTMNQAKEELKTFMRTVSEMMEKWNAEAAKGEHTLRVVYGGGVRGRARRA